MTTSSTSFLIEQALFGREGAETVVCWGQSPGFLPDWLSQAEEIIRDFGNRPLGVACPRAVFAQPIESNEVPGPLARFVSSLTGRVDRGHVAVVQVADQPGGFLGFHFLVMSRQDYEKFLGDPFHLAQKLPADWQARGALSAHSWPCVPLTARTLRDVQQVLQRLKAHALSEDWEPPAGAGAAETTKPKPAVEERTAENSESPALLGGAQVLVDGGRLVFERSAPDLSLVQGLWTLLPNTTRSQLWPASFAFSNHLQFDALVMPRLEGFDFEGYTSEEQAIDYPEGRYELNLQIAAETSDQDQLDGLLNRRSVRETWRLGIILLVFMIALVAASSVLDRFFPRSERSPAERKLLAAMATATIGAGHPHAATAILLAGKSIKVP